MNGRLIPMAPSQKQVGYDNIQFTRSMKQRLPLHGIRVHLSGSIPDDATKEQSEGIALFVERFARAVLREGGTLIHGSHPTFDQPLQAAARPFVSAGGA